VTRNEVKGRLLTDTQVGVDGRIAGSSSQVLVLTVRDVEVRLRVAVLLGQSKIDHVDLVAALANTHEKVVRLDVTVDERLGMDVLDAGDELVGEQENRLEREFAVAEVEQVLQARAEQVQDHGIVVALGAKPADEGDADAAGEGLVDAGFIFKLRMLGLDALELDGNLLARDDVCACLHVSWGDSAGLRATYRGRCRRNCRCQSCGRFYTCCRREDPIMVSSSLAGRVGGNGRCGAGSFVPLSSCLDGVNLEEAGLWVRVGRCRWCGAGFGAEVLLVWSASACVREYRSVGGFASKAVCKRTSSRAKQ
jgi:hypothetical protein